MQLLKQQGLCHMAMVVLIQDKPDQGRSVMLVFQIRRQLAHDITTVGCLIYLELIAGVVRSYLEVLNNPVFIIPETDPGGIYSGSTGSWWWISNSAVLNRFSEPGLLPLDDSPLLFLSFPSRLGFILGLGGCFLIRAISSLSCWICSDCCWIMTL